MRNNPFCNCYSLAVVCLLVVGCSSPPTSNVVTTRPSQTIVEPKKEPPELTVLETKQLLSEEPMDFEQLFEHVEHYIIAQRFQEARALLVTLAAYLPQEYHERARTLLALIAATNTTNDYTLDWLSVPSSNPNIEPLRTSRLISTLKYKGQYTEAMALEAADSSTPSTQHHTIFTQLTQFSDTDLTAIASQYTTLRPHIALIQLVRSNAADSLEFANAIEQFKRVYYAHPLTQPLPETVVKALNLVSANISQVVVMLPLSGRFEATGNAIKQGILAGYFDNRYTNSPQLTFADTESQSVEELVALAEEADWVIGPLLKNNIQKLLQASTHHSKHLVLNRLDDQQAEQTATSLVAQHSAFFGLAPEDEALQLAAYVTKRGYQRPIVVASNSSVSARMLEAFIAQWEGLTQGTALQKNLDVVTFDNIEGLDESLSKALGVAQSEDNANQIDRLTNKILFDQTRSRQDIDAIVVFATPEEMSLINPMVEASISPLREQQVPVFAASRSIELNTARNTLRDLENVHFLDTPLILHHKKAPEIKQTIAEIWPEQTSRFSRLFAFGYDSYTILPQLPLLMTLPGYQYSGLSGLLQMDDIQQINRHLPMAQVKQQTINLIQE